MQITNTKDQELIAAAGPRYDKVCKVLGIEVIPDTAESTETDEPAPNAQTEGAGA